MLDTGLKYLRNTGGTLETCFEQTHLNPPWNTFNKQIKPLPIALLFFLRHYKFSLDKKNLSGHMDGQIKVGWTDNQMLDTQINRSKHRRTNSYSKER